MLPKVAVGCAVALVVVIVFLIGSPVVFSQSTTQRRLQSQELQQREYARLSSEIDANKRLVPNLEAALEKLIKTAFHKAYVDSTYERIYLNLANIAEDETLHGLDQLWHSLEVRLVRKDGTISRHGLYPPCAFHDAVAEDDPRFHVVLLNFGQDWAGEYQSLERLGQAHRSF